MNAPLPNDHSDTVEDEQAEDAFLKMPLDEFEAFLDSDAYKADPERVLALICAVIAENEAKYSREKRGYLDNNERGPHYKTLISNFEKQKASFANWRETMLAKRVEWFERELLKVGITDELLEELKDDLSKGLNTYHKTPSALSAVRGTPKQKADKIFVDLRKKLKGTFGENSRKLRSIYNKIDGWALTFAESARIENAGEGVLVAAHALNKRTVDLQKRQEKIELLTHKLEILEERKAFNKAKASKVAGDRLHDVENINLLQAWLYPRAKEVRAALSTKITPLFDFMTAANDARPKLRTFRDMFDTSNKATPATLLADDLTDILNIASGAQSREPEVKAVMRVLDAQAQDLEHEVLGALGVDTQNPFVRYIDKRYCEDWAANPDANLLSRIFRVAQHVDTELGVANNNEPRTLTWNGSQTMRVTYNGSPPSGDYNVNMKVGPV